MSGRKSRNKGATGERELAALLTDALGVVVQRKLGQARDGGDDIQICQYRIEVKRREALRLDEWCKQVEDAAGVGDVPVVAYRRNGQPWRVVVPLEWFMQQVRETIKDAN